MERDPESGNDEDACEQEIWPVTRADRSRAYAVGPRQEGPISSPGKQHGLDQMRSSHLAFSGTVGSMLNTSVYLTQQQHRMKGLRQDPNARTQSRGPLIGKISIAHP